MRTRYLALALGFMALFAVAGVVLAAAPSAESGSASTPRNVAKVITLGGSTDTGTLNLTAQDPSHGQLAIAGSPVVWPYAMSCDPGGPPASCSLDVTYTPAAGYEGDDSFTFSVNDGTDGSLLPATISITVGSAPVAGDDPGVACFGNRASYGGSFPIPEDWPTDFSFNSSCGLLVNDTDADGDSLTWSVASGPAHGTLTKIDESWFAYKPDANFSTLAGDQAGGSWLSDSFTYTASDGVLTSAPATMKLWIAPINDPPTFTAGADVQVGEDSGSYSATWATNISAGPTNEAGQSVHFEVVAVDVTGVPNLFSVDPAIDSTGALTFTPGVAQVGLAKVTVRAVDDGGVEDYGVTSPGLPVPSDKSAETTFNIAVQAVNHAPSFAKGSDVAVDEDSAAYSGGWATAISAGPSDESGQTVSFSADTNDNGSLFLVAPAVSSAGVLTFTPAPNRNGTANVTFKATDSGGTANGGSDTSAGQTVVITVNPVNDLPNAVTDTGFTVGENAAATSLNVLANDTSLPDAPEMLLIVSTGTANHGTVTITGGGTGLTYRPSPLYYGSDFFTYTIHDPDGAADTATVLLNVVKDGTAPTSTAPTEVLRWGTYTGTASVPVRFTWTGSDAGVGLARFDLQRSVNAGAYGTLTLSSPKATTYDTTLAIASTTYRYRVRAVDVNGNVGAWRYGPSFSTARYQESATTYIKYGGAWSLSSNASYSNSYTRYASTAGRYVTFTRSVRDVAFVAPTSSGRGSARIYVDGVLVTAVSLRTSTVQYRRVLWATHFSTFATHTIKVVVVGNGRVDLDCFIALR